MSNLSRDAKKEKRLKLLNQLAKLEEIINTLPDNFTKEYLIKLISDMKTTCKSYSEVIRLAEAVVMWVLDEDNDSFYKGLLRKELYKLYVK